MLSEVDPIPWTKMGKSCSSPTPKLPRRQRIQGESVEQWTQHVAARARGLRYEASGTMTCQWMFRFSLEPKR
jgi:hypothetical protein